MGRYGKCPGDQKPKKTPRGFSIQQLDFEILPTSLTVFPAVPSATILLFQVSCHVYTVTGTGAGNCVVGALLLCHRRDFSFCCIQCGYGGADYLCEVGEINDLKCGKYN